MWLPDLQRKGFAVSSRAIEAVIFDLDNTLTDFMLAKQNSIGAAVDAMIDAGLDARLGLTQPEARTQAAALPDNYRVQLLPIPKVI